MQNAWPLLVVCAALCNASTIETVGSAGVGFVTDKWNNGHVGRPGNDGSPYFSNPSVEGGRCNAAYYISGTSSGCSAASQPGGIDRLGAPGYAGPGAEANFWAHTSSPYIADLNFNFAPTTGLFTIQLMVEATANHTRNQFGLYSVDSSGNVLSTLLLFAGSDGPGSLVLFTPGDNSFGFFINNGSSIFSTESARNKTGLGAPIDTGVQHFAAFRDPSDPDYGRANSNWSKLWILVSDGTEGTNAYNDMILYLQCADCSGGVISGDPSSAPEPGTLALVAAGAAMIACSARTKRRHRPN